MPFSSDGFWKRVAGIGAPAQEKKDWVIIQDPSLLVSRDVPWELKCALSVKPSRRKSIARLLEQGQGLGFCLSGGVPQAAMQAVKRISDLTHEGLAAPWLESFIRSGEVPVWSEQERRTAEAQGIDLSQEMDTLKRLRAEHCRCVPVGKMADQGELGDDDCLAELNQDLMAISMPHLMYLMRTRVQGWRFPWKLMLLTSFIIVGPLAWLLSGAPGMLLAALFPGCFLVGGEIYRSRVCGRPWDKKDSLWLSAWIVLSLTLAGMSYHLGQSFYAWRSGLLFGLAILPLPMRYVLRYLSQSVKALRKLEQNGRLAFSVEGAGFRTVLEQEHGLMARFLGLILAIPVLGGIFSLSPSAMANGWWLAVVACLPICSAEFLAWLELNRDRLTYYRSLKRLWRQAIVLSSDAW